MGSFPKVLLPPVSQSFLIWREREKRIFQNHASYEAENDDIDTKESRFYRLILRTYHGHQPKV
tara:strand:- start:396 stop:584 length:189 start_codon:yes stop_codon:yes gene_type:complete